MRSLRCSTIPKHTFACGPSVPCSPLAFGFATQLTSAAACGPLKASWLAEPGAHHEPRDFTTDARGSGHARRSGERTGHRQRHGGVRARVVTRVYGTTLEVPQSPQR